MIASEDSTFFEHRGVRPLSVLRALWQNVTCRRRISGASTITMQAVRLIEPHPKNLFEKYVEAIKALKMERERDKLWILSQYLNRAPFGSNLVGIEAAAQGWFGHSAKNLGLGEAACLAGMVQAPSRFRPDRAFDLALKRREYVLGRMLELGFITADQREAASSVRPVLCRSPRPFREPYFCDFALAELGRDRSGQRRYGDFRTALDADIQSTCNAVVNAAAKENGASAAVVVLKVATGEVVALACSGNYFDPTNGQFNTALAPRPAGSTLKPLLAALAYDRGLVTPETMLSDVPVAYKGYRPSNFDARFRGLVSVRDALILSLNLPFVRLLDEVGVREFGTCLRSLGLRHMTRPDSEYGLGMAIGNVELSLVELVRAYGVIARGGGEVFTREAAYLVSEDLSGDERSFASLGHIADVEVPRFAWKTGTSAGFRDAWTVAWNPEYAVGVWCGHVRGGFGDERIVGAKAAAPAAWKIARSLYPRNDGPWFREPAGIFRRRICAVSGLPASVECRDTAEGRAIRGRSANLPCSSHRAESRLTISRPEPDAVIRIVPGLVQQKITCRVIGNAADATLWWFADGVPVGESHGLDPFALDLAPGEHTLVCADESGRSATVSFTVR